MNAADIAIVCAGIAAILSLAGIILNCVALYIIKNDPQFIKDGFILRKQTNTIFNCKMASCVCVGLAICGGVAYKVLSRYTGL